MFYWFKHGDKYETLPQEIKDDPFMERVGEACRIAGLSNEKLETYLLDMKTELDYEWGLDCARDEGLEEGLERGREEGLEEGLERGREEKALETARNFKASGIAAEIIARCVGLPIETVLAL